MGDTTPENVPQVPVQPVEPPPLQPDPAIIAYLERSREQSGDVRRR